MLESVERRLAPLPSEVEFKAIKAKLDGTDKDSWNKAVQGRLEEIEERLDRLAEDEEEGEGRKGVGMSSDEVARMVKTAVDDALLRADRARNEEHSSWRLQVCRHVYLECVGGGPWKACFRCTGCARRCVSLNRLHPSAA